MVSSVAKSMAMRKTLHRMVEMKTTSKSDWFTDKKVRIRRLPLSIWLSISTWRGVAVWSLLSMISVVTWESVRWTVGWFLKLECFWNESLSVIPQIAKNSTLEASSRSLVPVEDLRVRRWGSSPRQMHSNWSMNLKDTLKHLKNALSFVHTVRDSVTSREDRWVHDDFLRSFYFCWKGTGNLSLKSSVKIAHTTSGTYITIYSKEGQKNKVVSFTTGSHCLTKSQSSSGLNSQSMDGHDGKQHPEWNATCGGYFCNGIGRGDCGQDLTGAHNNL